MSRRKTTKKKAAKKPEAKPLRSFVETILYVPVLAGLPLLFAWLLQLRDPLSQHYLSFLILGSLLLACWLKRMETEELHCNDPCLSGLFFHGCILMISLIVWNYLFRVYISNVDFTADIFRTRFRNFYAPLYGYAQTPSIKGFLCCLIPGGIFAAYLLKNRNRAIEKGEILIPAAFLLMFSISMALTDDVSRLTDWMAHYGYFAQGLPLFSSISDLLLNYTPRMDQLGVHNNHYPPGILLTLKIEDLSGLKDLTRLLVMLSSIGTLWVLKRTGKMLGGAETCSRLAVFLFILSPGILVYITVDPGFIVIFPASLALYFFLQGMMTGTPAYALGMGLMFSLYTFFSFSSGFLALLLGIIFLLLWRGGLIRFSVGLTQITLSIGFFAAAYLILFYATGFNILACLKEAVRNNTNQMSSGFDNGFRYLFRSTGAILVYLTTAGFPQSYLIFRTTVRAIKAKNLNSFGNLLAIGVCISLLVSGFSGFFYLETERIWLFFTPALVMAAAFEADRIYQNRGFAPTATLLVCSMLLTMVYELYLQPFAWR